MGILKTYKLKVWVNIESMSHLYVEHGHQPQMKKVDGVCESCQNEPSFPAKYRVYKAAQPALACQDLDSKSQPPPYPGQTLVEHAVYLRDVFPVSTCK